ncbi:MAG: hypothetical protein JWP91_2784 [Fibrobacteres bacterium]|nr:hypothetical protein [Fibrobacterota bacterium]
MPPKRPVPHRQAIRRTGLLMGWPGFSAFPGFAFAAFAFTALLAVCLCACVERVAGKGGGTETESNVAGLAVNPDGSPSVGARVILRPADYLADPVSAEDTGSRRQETVTDSHGRFKLRELPAGDYRIEIAGSESGGSIRDFSLRADGQGMRLPADTVKPRGSIKGAFAPDSEAQLARFIQVFGMERLVKADPSGGFILYNLPEGEYAIRCSSLQPFRRDAVRRGISVKSGEQTTITAVQLEKEAKLAFTVDGGGLRIEGLDSTNPVILDNERWDNGVENEYVWAKASAGSLDLRGNIVTADLKSAVNTVPDQVARGQAELRGARNAGLQGIPDLVGGASARLVSPASGRLEDIKASPSPGSDLIVAEARKATPEKPLVVVVGGPLTTVAQAWLTDPTIAPRMVVAGVFSYSLQNNDSIANYLVAKNCRFVQWGRTYTWGGKPDTARIAQVPLSRMGERVRAYLSGNKDRMSFGDLAPVAFLFRRGAWMGANMVKVSSTLEVQPASDITFDFLDIPFGANDWPAYEEEFYRALSDPAAYHPIAEAPGRFEAEGLSGGAAVGGLPVDSVTAGVDGIGFSANGSADYKLTVSKAGAYRMTVRYRTGGGARIAISAAGGAVLGELPLPASYAWAEAVLDSLPLEAGPLTLRVTGIGGSFNLDWMDLRP